MAPTKRTIRARKDINYNENAMANAFDITGAKKTKAGSSRVKKAAPKKTKATSSKAKKEAPKKKTTGKEKTTLANKEAPKKAATSKTRAKSASKNSSSSLSSYHSGGDSPTAIKEVEAAIRKQKNMDKEVEAAIQTQKNLDKFEAEYKTARTSPVKARQSAEALSGPPAAKKAAKGKTGSVSPTLVNKSGKLRTPPPAKKKAASPKAPPGFKAPIFLFSLKEENRWKKNRKASAEEKLKKGEW